MLSNELAATAHRRIIDPEDSVARSSFGGPAETSLALKANRALLDKVLEQASSLATADRNPVAPPPPAVLSERPELADALINGAIGGDPKAIGQLLASIRPLVVRYCRARIGRLQHSFVSADDVAQEVCLAVLTALPGYQNQGRPFLAFVYGIASHKVADAHRAAARNCAEPMAETPDAPVPGDGPEQQAIRGELTRRMSELLRVLPDKQREIVVLRVVVGLSAEETAQAVGSSPGAVRVAQHRALVRLRKTLASMEDPCDS